MHSSFQSWVDDFAFSKELEMLESRESERKASEGQPRENQTASTVATVSTDELDRFAETQRVSSSAEVADELRLARERRQGERRQGGSRPDEYRGSKRQLESAPHFDIPDLSASVQFARHHGQSAMSGRQDVSTHEQDDLSIRQASRILELERQVEELERDNRILALQVKELLDEQEAMQMVLDCQEINLQRFRPLLGNFYFYG